MEMDETQAWSLVDKISDEIENGDIKHCSEHGWFKEEKQRLIAIKDSLKEEKQRLIAIKDSLKDVDNMLVLLQVSRSLPPRIQAYYTVHLLDKCRIIVKTTNSLQD